MWEVQGQLFVFESIAEANSKLNVKVWACLDLTSVLVPHADVLEKLIIRSHFVGDHSCRINHSFPREPFHRSALEKFWCQIPSPIAKGRRHQVGISVRKQGLYYKRWPVKYHTVCEHAQQNDAIWEDVTVHPPVTRSPLGQGHTKQSNLPALQLQFVEEPLQFWWGNPPRAGESETPPPSLSYCWLDCVQKR